MTKENEYIKKLRSQFGSINPYDTPEYFTGKFHNPNAKIPQKREFTPCWIEGLSLSMNTNKESNVINFTISKGIIADLQFEKIPKKSFSIEINTTDVIYNTGTLMVWLDLEKNILKCSEMGMIGTKSSEFMLLWEIEYTVYKGKLKSYLYTNHRGRIL